MACPRTPGRPIQYRHDRDGAAVSVEVRALSSVEILDSRGRPRHWVTSELTDWTVAEAGVPSGGSTGSREDCELRDGDPDRFADGVVPTAVSLLGIKVIEMYENLSVLPTSTHDQPSGWVG